IERVRKDGLKLHHEALVKMEILHERQVDILHRRTLQDIDSRVSEPSDACRVVADRIIVGATGDLEGGDVEPVGRSGPACWRKAGAGDTVGPAAQGVRVGWIEAVEARREELARLQSHNGRNAPAAEYGLGR